MTPDVFFKDSNAGGAAVGAAVGSLFGGLGSLVGAMAGDVLTPKINNLKVYKGPDKTSESTEITNKVDEVVYLGESSNGCPYVQGADIEGWVQGVILR